MSSTTRGSEAEATAPLAGELGEPLVAVVRVTRRTPAAPERTASTMGSRSVTDMGENWASTSSG